MLFVFSIIIWKFFSKNPSGDAAEKFALSLTCRSFSFWGELLNLVRLNQIDPGDL